MDESGIIIITCFVFCFIVFIISLIPWINMFFIWLKYLISDLIYKWRKKEDYE